MSNLPQDVEVERVQRAGSDRRVQSGLRIERRLLKVLKALAQYKNMTLDEQVWTLARVCEETRMSLRSIAGAFLALWWTLGVLLVVYSVQTAWHALGAGRDGTDVHVAVLASVEAIAGLLFLVPKTMRAGGACLLAVFAVAIVLHGRKGEFASQLLLYAAAVSFVMVHGPVPLGAFLGQAKQ